MDIIFNGRKIEESDPFEVYRDMLADLYVTELSKAECLADSRFEAWSLGDVLIHSGNHMPARYARTRSLLANSKSDDIALMLVHDGEYRASAGDAREVCRSGEVMVLDRRKEIELGTTANRMTNFSFPRHMLERLGLDLELFHGRKVDTLAGGVLAKTLQGLAESPKAPGDLQAPLVEICGIALGAMTPLPRTGGHDRLRVAAGSIIDRRLDDDTLSVADLCREIGASRAVLYRAFETDGGVHRYIRERRLRESRRRLTQPNARMTSIAMDLGFASASHFSRSFRREYGITPSSFARLASGRAEGGKPVDRLNYWKDLAGQS